MSIGVFAETRIAILDFELKDLTMIPRTPAEIKRTASIKPLLEGELKKADYVIINFDPKSQKLAESGVGYLMGHLIRVSDAKLIGDYISEAKGPNRKLTIKAVESLTVKIDKTLDNRYSPPPSKQKQR